MENNPHEIAKQIRQDFFAFRNGLLADALKDSGDKHRMIFGLNITQIADIAKKHEPTEHVANELWQSAETRECRLIAPMIYPIDKFDKATALNWISQIENTEISDNLCHKLLRHTSYASALCLELTDGSDMQRYTSMRLAINLIATGKNIDNNKMHEFAKNELSCNNSANISVAKRLIEDLSEIE